MTKYDKELQSGTKEHEDALKPEQPRRDWQEERGGRIDPLGSPDSPMDGDDRVDEAIAESFPASDPPSFNGGLNGDVG